MTTLAPTAPFPSDPQAFEASIPTPQQVGDFVAQTYRNMLETMTPDADGIDDEMVW